MLLDSGIRYRNGRYILRSTFEEQLAEAGIPKHTKPSRLDEYGIFEANQKSRGALWTLSEWYALSGLILDRKVNPRELISAQKIRFEPLSELDNKTMVEIFKYNKTIPNPLMEYLKSRVGQPNRFDEDKYTRQELDVARQVGEEIIVRVGSDQIAYDIIHGIIFFRTDTRDIRIQLQALKDTDISLVPKTWTEGKLDPAIIESRRKDLEKRVRS